MAFLIQASHIANANGMVVVVLDMSTGILLLAAFMDGAVLVDDPVVANHGVVAGLVPAVDVGDSDWLVDTGGCTMYDDVQYFFHWFHFLTQNFVILSHTDSTDSTDFF